MNANPLKARYIKGKRRGGKGWKNLGDRYTSMVRIDNSNLKIKTMWAIA